jgi:6-phosphogluconolactonase
MITKMIWPDAYKLSEAAAHFFLLHAQEAIEKNGRFVVALSGGSTPKTFLEILATPAFSKNVDWKKVFFFWSDERFVPLTDKESNYKMAWDSLLSKVPVPKKNIFATPVKGPTKDCAKQYETTLKSFFGGKTPAFDWLMLGMGDDGHTASLFPGTDILQENKRLVKEVWVESKQTWRISFTYPLINKARQVVLLVAGNNKAPILKTVFAKKAKAVYPVQGVNPKTSPLWLVDEAAVNF